MKNPASIYNIWGNLNINLVHCKEPAGQFKTSNCCNLKELSFINLRVKIIGCLMINFLAWFSDKLNTANSMDQQDDNTFTFVMES